jgi:hypothetical protein
MKNKKCLFCDQPSDYICPIAGGKICSTTCHEISEWADEKNSGNDVYLEYFPQIRNYCKVILKLSDDKTIGDRCRQCDFHWKGEGEKNFEETFKFD